MELWRHIDLQDGRRRRRESTSGFNFGDVSHLRTSKSIRIPNFAKIAQSAAEISIFPVSENRRPPYWNSTSGSTLTPVILHQQPLSEKHKTRRLLYRLLSVLVTTAGVHLVYTLVFTATTHPCSHLKDQSQIARSGPRFIEPPVSTPLRPNRSIDFGPSKLFAHLQKALRLNPKTRDLSWIL